ncbi:MAG: class A beta-lactamase-related serine hydrolase [Candidatus Shapirobacteria bacterium]|nr:class A beta-lactamase-related serine hydrolase [Candidatus Shapirobacteria bacterium]
MILKKIFVVWFFSLLIIFLVGFLIGKTKNEEHYGEEIVRKNFNYKYINPILECNSDISLNSKLTPIKESIESIINQEVSKKNITFASIYYRDLNNGPWFGINEKEYFSPASLIKVPILIAYLKKAETDPSLLQKKLTVSDNPETGNNIQNIKPSVATVVKQEYTIEKLLEEMIIYSDNNAYNTLAENLTGDEIMKVYQDLDVDISKAFENPNGNIITVKNYASFFRILYNGSYLNNEMSEKALKLLNQVEYKDALVAGVPKDIMVSHKFGERKYLDTNEIQFHDCGIVYFPKKPYLLCVMTKTTQNANKAINFIKEISQVVYRSQNKQ